MSQPPIVMSDKLNHGTVAIEQSRAITEAQAKYYFAKQYPRDEIKAGMRVLDSCKRSSLAETACYSFPRGKETVSGPSIRLAEEIARCWGNIDYGIRELSNADGESEMEAFAIDLETNTISRQTFKVRHIRDTKFNSAELTNQRDIYELTANMGARRLRSRILAILPPDIVEDAVKECRKTLKGGNDKPMADRIKDLLKAFQKHSVNREMLERRLAHAIEDISEDELVDLRGIFNSLNNVQTKRSDWFELASDEPAPSLTGGKKNFSPGKPATQEPVAAPEQKQPAEETGEDPFDE